MKIKSFAILASGFRLIRIAYPRCSIHPIRFKVMQTPDSMYFLYEYNQSWRPIAMNQKYGTDPDPTWFGEAVGKWEGDTLAVDAIGFN